MKEQDTLFWNRFKRNKLSLSGLLIIALSFLIALLGYLIVPDPTPYANEQLLSIAAKPPMFRITLATIRKNRPAVKQSVLHTMLFGKESNYRYIPIDNFRFSEDSVIYKEYSDAAFEETFETKVHLADAVYSLDIAEPIKKLVGGTFLFTTTEGVQKSVSSDSLKKVIIRKQIFSKTYLLGTDRFGRDMLSRLMLGTRVSFSVGFISVFISLLIGISLGVTAGYFRGKTDIFITWLVNVVWSVPTLLMVLSITLVLGKGFWQVFLAVGLTMWVEVARVVRGQVLTLREKEFIEAAKALGYGNLRILFRHIVPNVIGPVVIISAANFASAILMEAGLSFLGIGVQPPIPSWGNMIKDHYGYIILDQPYLAIFPGLAIMLLVLAFNFVGNGLRDAFDTRIE